MGERLDVKVTFRWNNNCLFCAPAHKRDFPDPPLEKLKAEIRKGREEGKDEIVFTGGEPTFRKELPELVKYARDLGYRIIQIQTNGRLLYYRKFIEKLVRAGATEFSPSIHGHTAEIHEAQTRAPGSFKQVYNGIRNLRDMGLYVITNTVITKINYKYLPQIAEMLVNLDVNQLQFAFIHIIGNGWKFRDIMVPRKTEVQPYLHRALDYLKEHGYGPGRAMVEAFPFCLMRGYEKYCSELYMPQSKVVDAGFIIDNFTQWRLKEGKVKFPQCEKCRFNSICEGPWKEYPEMFGSSEFKPVEGPPVRSPDDL